MDFQSAYVRLATISSPPTPIAKPAHDKPPTAANDNYQVWPLPPFPAGWHASN